MFSIDFLYSWYIVFKQAHNGVTDAFSFVELIKPSGCCDETADPALTKLARALLTEGRLPQALSVAQVIHCQASALCQPVTTLAQRDIPYLHIYAPTIKVSCQMSGARINH